MKKSNHYVKRGAALLLSLAVVISGINFPAAGSKAEAADSKISIANAKDLAKIGKDAEYPMSGDYVLTEDIDLSGSNWTPIGGTGAGDYGLVSGEQVFNGTFDGQGHVIRNMTIQFDGSTSANSKNFSGLFGMVGSDNSSDYAEVKNIVFTDVSISHTLGGGDCAGTLAASVNGFVKVDNIAVLTGTVSVSGKGGDLVGLGGIVGQIRNNCSAVQMRNLYNAAAVTASGNLSDSWVRCGGILGRVHQSDTIGTLTACVNVGTVTYKTGQGYAINGYSNNQYETAASANISNCYSLTGSGVKGVATEMSESGLAAASVVTALGEEYWEIYQGKLIPSISQGKVTVPIPEPVFAEGDTVSSVTQDFTLPLSYDIGEEIVDIVWTSSHPEILSISGSTVKVTPVLEDTQVTLTATAGARVKNVTVTVRSNLTLELDQEYANPGTPLKAAVANAPEGISFTYRWQVDGTTVSSADTYTPVADNLNHFITVTAYMQGTGASVDSLQLYCSKLPVVYVNTNDGYGITSKITYKDATMKIQGNDIYNSSKTSLYDGKIEIRGRGNSTWNTGYSKLPYKIKLDKKTDLFGFGKSKHWTLLANYMDESLLRNKISYDLSGAMGMVYLKSANVDVILNGNYAGNYQLVGNVRIEESRANVYDWEECVEDAAKAIAKGIGLSADQQDALETQMNRYMTWITSDQVTFNGQTYTVSDYYKEIPKDEDGNTDLSGGFLFELDQYYDEHSKFETNYSQPIMFKNPEFIDTNYELFTSAKDYIQAVENSFHASDYYVDYQGQKEHYTDLVDMDSLVRYFVLNEFFWNTETMKKSTYMYKDLGGKLFIGPVWDMDWTSNSQVSQGQTGNYSVWMTNVANDGSQSYQWYKYLIGDPYFLTKVYECYTSNKSNFEEIIITGGIIDQQQEYQKESAQANYNAGYLMHRSDFTTETERLRTFLANRLNWMDQQFTSVDKLITSFGKYEGSGIGTITVDTSKEGSTTYTAAVTNGNARKVGFYLNGILAGTADVSNSQAGITLDDSYLTGVKDELQVVQVRGMDASSNLLNSGTVTNYTTFTKEITAEELIGTVTISGEAKVGAKLTATVEGTNNTGTLSYQWKAAGVAIEGAVQSNYLVTANELGKVITVEVRSSAETGVLTSAATAAVAQEQVKNDHVIINQVYGDGNKGDGAVSHSFIELYNPTETSIDLSGYSLGYLSNGTSAPAAAEVRLTLQGVIPAHTSYLVRGAGAGSEANTYSFTVNAYDLEWPQAIDNKQYRIVLYNGDSTEDALSIGEGSAEGAELEAGAISKQKAVRRVNFADTNSNLLDFTVIDYREVSSDLYPRSLASGAWGVEGGEDPIGSHTVTFEVDGKLTDVKVENGKAVQPITLPQREGYTFEGWYLNDEKYDFTTIVTSDIRLVARWTKNQESETPPTESETPPPESETPPTESETPPTESETPPTEAPAPPVTVLGTPDMPTVTAVVSSGKTKVSVKVKTVAGAESYKIYRKKGSAVTFLGETKKGTFYDTKPVSGTAAYLVKAVKGTTESSFSPERSIKILKATGKITTKVEKTGSKRTVTVKWKKVVGATGYYVYRSLKATSGYKRVAVIKKAKTTVYLDKKAKKGKKYYYRVVAMKAKVYGLEKTSKVVKTK